MMVGSKLITMELVGTRRVLVLQYWGSDRGLLGALDQRVHLKPLEAHMISLPRLAELRNVLNYPGAWDTEFR